MSEEPKPKTRKGAKPRPKEILETTAVTESQQEPALKKEENKTLVVYSTKGGATGDAANVIAETLREKNGLEVDVIDLKRQPHPDLSGYKNIVVGGGVRKGKVYKETVEFMKQDLGSKRVAVFICSGAAGNPFHKNEVAEKYITKGLASNPTLNVVSKEAFGGCIKIFGKPIMDRRDSAKVQTWAEEVGKKFTE